MSLVVLVAQNKVQNEEEKQALKACRGCLDTDVELFDIQQVGLKQLFGDFTGIAVIPTDGYPQFVCGMCLCLLRKFFTFRTRCHTAMYMLQQTKVTNSKITTDTVKKIDRTRLKLNLFTTNTEIFDCTENEVSLIEANTENLLSADDIGDDVSDKSILRMCLDPKSSENEEIINDGELKSREEEFDFDHITEFDEEDIIIIIPEDEKRNSTRKETVKNNSVNKVFKAKRETNITLKKEIERLKNDRINLKKKREEHDMYVTGVWKTIMKEINYENLRCKMVKRKPFNIADIKHFTEQANKISEAYNVEVKFLTVEEQRRELEQKRRSDAFIKGPYKCELCVKVFITLDTYKRHTMQHDPEKKVMCEVCQYTFKDVSMYRSHFHAMHFKKITCNVCGLFNRHWTEAENHYKWHTGAKISCEHCDMSFSVRKLYMMHLRNKHHIGSTQCVLCHKKFIGDVGLKIHMDKIHKLAVRCSSCDSCFNDDDALQRHLEDTTCICSPNISSCPMCGVNFTSEQLMEEHIEELHKKTFKCEQCDMCLDSEQQYKSHAQRHFNASKKVGTDDSDHFKVLSKCDDCKTEKLCYHRKHGREKPYKCAKCIRSFFRSQSLKTHMRQFHGTESKGFICEVCGMEKRSLAHLKCHQRTHTGEKPYKCNMCDKDFAQYSTLKCHIATHTGERAYKCSLCGKAFVQPAHLRAHMFTHTKERPYACNMCEKRYRNATSLKEHKDTIHMGLPHRKWGKKNKRT